MEIEEDKNSMKTDNNGMKLQSEIFSWTIHADGALYALVYKGGGKTSSKLAGFDFDGTIVTVKSGATFAKSGDDWKLFDKNIPSLIKRFYNESYRFVIFSNQRGISSGHMSFDNVKMRLSSALTAIDIPCVALLSLQDDIYRKPRPGMLYLMENYYNESLQFNYENSFYVGDAAGRKTSLVKDHSAADLLFAINTKIPFLTPEQFVAKLKPRKLEDLNLSLHKLPSFNPRELIKTSHFMTEIGSKGKEIQKFPSFSQLKKEKLDTISGPISIIFSGISTSGKTTFYDYYFSHLKYERIDSDKLKNDKFEEEFTMALLNGGDSAKIIIDGANIDKSSRNKWINICKSKNVYCICFYFNIAREHALHNNIHRKLLHQLDPNFSNNSSSYFLINKHSKELQSPSLEEGFDNLFKINFTPCFKNDEFGNDRLYYMYLI